MKQEIAADTNKRGICQTGYCLLVLMLFSLILVSWGCKSPIEHRSEADNVAAEIITAKQKEALGESEPFSIERPSDILRRRLLEQQNLAVSSEASLGTDKLKPVEHWPDPNYLQPKSSGSSEDLTIEPNKPVKLSLVQSLQVGAYNSLEYQSRKENVFRTALALDLTRHNFENIFNASADSQLSTDTTATDLDNSATAGVSRTLKNGIDMSAAIGINLFNLLTQGGMSSMGLSGDASISIPLLRGSGEYIAAEPLTQAERNVVYELWSFERY